LIPFVNLLKYFPNIAELPRDTFIAHTSQDDGFIYSTLYNNGRNAFLGLDMTVNNESGSQSTFYLDSRNYWVLDASVRTLTNIPFNTFQIGTTGATPNRIDTTIFGISLDLLEKMSGRSTYDLVYGDYPSKQSFERPIFERLLIGDRG